MVAKTAMDAAGGHPDGSHQLRSLTNPTPTGSVCIANTEFLTQSLVLAHGNFKAAAPLSATNKRHAVRATTTTMGQVSDGGPSACDENSTF